MRKLEDVGRDCARWSMPIGEAVYPAPFSTEPEFNAPVHGTWNIVHTGMLVPEAHQIYVCAINCMRGVVLAAAQVLQERFGTPYVVGAPMGGFAQAILTAMEQVGESKMDTVPYLSRPGGKAAVTLIGEPVTMGSLAAAITAQYSVPVRVLCPMETWEGLLAPGDQAVSGEEELAQALGDTETVVADPLYRPVCPEDCKFYELPHLAFSGRCFRKKMPNLFELEMESYGTE